MQQTPTQRLADSLLGGGLRAYVRDRRLAGKSWRQISLDLRDDIQVDVTYETLRNWYCGIEHEAKDSAA